MLSKLDPNKRYDTVWQKAEPYMRARKNDVHIPLSFAWAQRLLEAHPEADKDIVSYFYRYLHGMADQAQFIVIENHKSDQDVVRPYANYQFTKNPSIGRAGLFI